MLLLTLGMGYLLTAAALDLGCGVSPLPALLLTLGVGYLLTATAPYLEHGIATLACSASDLGRVVSPHGRLS